MISDDLEWGFARYSEMVIRGPWKPMEIRYLWKYRVGGSKMTYFHWGELQLRLRLCLQSSMHLRFWLLSTFAITAGKYWDRGSRVGPESKVSRRYAQHIIVPPPMAVFSFWRHRCSRICCIFEEDGVQRVEYRIHPLI
jgi:hypothetical protein